MVNKKRTKKCAICNNPNVCINYRDSFICEDCLGYITGLEPLHQHDTEERYMGFKAIRFGTIIGQRTICQGA